MLHDILDSSIALSNVVIRKVDYKHRVVDCKFIYICALCYDAAMKNNNVIYVDFANRRENDIWELHCFALAIRCPDEKYQALIARRIEELDALKTPYKIFLDGALVHYEKHLGRS